MPNSNIDLSERELFARGPVVVFRWQNLPGWPVEYVSPNAAEVFGFSAEQFLAGEAIYANLIHTDDIKRVSAEVAQGSESDSATVVHEPYRIIRADGVTRWLYDMTHVIRDAPDAKPTHTLEIGIIVVPSNDSIGSPTIVFTSIISFILSIVVLIKFSMG